MQETLPEALNRGPMKPPRLQNVFVVLAAAAIVYGCWRIYPPAGWIVGGLLVLVDSIDVIPPRRA